MSVTKKRIFSICFKGCYAVFIGIGIVTVFSILLASYAGTQQEVTVETHQVAVEQHISFPEDEQMLEEMSQQLAQEAISLSEIAPAAGDNLN